MQTLDASAVPLATRYLMPSEMSFCISRPHLICPASRCLPRNPMNREIRLQHRIAPDAKNCAHGSRSLPYRAHEGRRAA